MLHGSFIHTSVTIRVSAFIFIFVEVALGRLYAIDRNLSLDEIKLLPPVIQHLEVPEVPPDYEDDDKPIPVKNVDAIIGGKAELPCDMYPIDDADNVYLVLWYKDIDGKPLYSFDVRKKSPMGGGLEGQHWSAPNSFGGRAFFRAERNTSYLLITNVTSEDEGMYRCRVDYRNSPTRNIKLNLTVVVPPNTPQVTSGDKRIDTSGSIAGVYNENDIMNLTCISTGGKPPPSLTWWINYKMVDATFHLEGSDKVVNKLKRMNAERHLNGGLLECRSQNNNATKPQSRILKIDINLIPTKVKILNPPKMFQVGKEYRLVCLAQGSRPPPEITWKIGRYNVKSKVTSEILETAGSMKSIIKFTPKREDNGKQISCKAENPRMRAHSKEDNIFLSISYPPDLTLKWGNGLRARHIKQGADVYLECQVDANPKVETVEWYHGNRRIFEDRTNGIYIHDFTLVIQKCNLNHTGEYTCRADNKVGKRTSNTRFLNIKHAPICHPNNQRKYGVLVGETINITCTVFANPHADRFRWWYTEMGKRSEFQQHEFAVFPHRNLSYSVLGFTRKSDSINGAISCSAENKIGRQRNPCYFELKSATRPDKPTRCKVYNGSRAVEVRCSPGYDGGRSQQFKVEVYDVGRKRLIHRQINRKTPHFELLKLKRSSRYRIEVFATNRIGDSNRTELKNINIPSIYSNSNNNSSDIDPSEEDTQLSSVYLVVAIVGFFILAFILVVLILAIRKQQKWR